jgi:L-iditol 2-dehydrogenase
MRAIVWRGEREYGLEDVPEPVAAPGQVIVQIAATAVCGSDLHLKEFGAPPPIIPGHEGCGVVVDTGDGSSALHVGDRVTLNPVQTCGECYCCTHGMEHLCLRTRHLGSGPVPGTWAERVAVDAANAHVIPDSLSFEAAAVTEPVAVCYESYQRSGSPRDASVLVIGDGPFGFLHARLATALGARTVVCAGHYDERLARIAEHTGAVVCNTRRDDLSGVIGSAIGPDLPGIDIAIEASGSGAAPSIGLRALRPRGTLVVFSSVWDPEPLAMWELHMRELTIVAACRSLHAFEPCLALMADGRVDTGQLIDVSVPMAEFRDAFDRLATRKAHHFKALLRP